MNVRIWGPWGYPILMFASILYHHQWRHNCIYLMTFVGKLLKSKTIFMKSKLPRTNFISYFGVRKLILKPIKTYNVGTKYYHMQQYFDSPVILKRGEDHFRWSRS